jgi:hypothetical protein
MKIIILFCAISYFSIITIGFPQEYPEEYLDTLDLWKYNFDKQQEPVNVKPKRSVNDGGINIQDYLIETKLCESKIVFTRPQKLKNVDNKLMTIVNHRNYTQFVRFENCLEPSFPCTRDIYPFDIKSFCHQNFHKVKLLAFDQERNCLLEDYFVVPSTCDCMIDKNDLFKGVYKNLLNEE